MADISHASLTGAQLHEPKGVETASLGQVYIANGSGSGSWGDVGTASFTGMIADFTWPVVQDGWLELDGSVISSTTYSGLYAVMTIQMSGSRTNGSAVITNLSSTANMRAGYFVFGAGITSGTTIISVDSGTQITLSANAGSSGTATVIVSPWLIGSGTIQLPDVSTAGRYRRSRTSSTRVGQTLADQNKAHTHSLSVSGTTATDGAHTHTANVTDPGHTHIHNANAQNSGGFSGGSATLIPTNGAATINNATTGITVSIPSSGAHSHSATLTGTSGSEGGTEARPLTLVVMTCVKT